MGDILLDEREHRAQVFNVLLPSNAVLVGEVEHVLHVFIQLTLVHSTQSFLQAERIFTHLRDVLRLSLFRGEQILLLFAQSGVFRQETPIQL